MSVGGLEMLNEYALVKFKALDKTYLTVPEEASGLAQGFLLRGAYKASLVFTDVVISRTTFSRRAEGVFNHALTMYNYEGPISTQQFIKMMRYNKKLSNEEVGEYFDRWSKYGVSKL